MKVPRRRNRSPPRPQGAPAELLLPFPLAKWIDDHFFARFSLARSGMVGSLRSTPSIIRGAAKSTERELLDELAESLRVDSKSIFLTHGATEANTLALWYIRRKCQRRRQTQPRFFVSYPEYPPIVDAALTVGFRRTGASATPDLVATSDPKNPTGQRLGDADYAQMRRPLTHFLIDETYREFTNARSRACENRSGTWCVGTLTKAYGADSVRLGWLVTPPEERASFARFHGLLTDGIPQASVDSATALLRNRADVLHEARSIVNANMKILRSSISGVGPLSAPLWFDRGKDADSGDRLSRSALRKSVLVCPGSFFGDSRGVRVTMTRRSFRRDFREYLAVRDRAPGFAGRTG